MYITYMYTVSRGSEGDLYKYLPQTIIFYCNGQIMETA